MYYLSNNSETAWADKASGEYEEGFKVALTAVSKNTSAKLVYTTNGSNPTASSTQVTSGTSINISSSCTLKVGLLINGTVSGIRTYNYSIKRFEPYNITVYVNTDAVNWKKVNFHFWSNINVKTDWPGTPITQTKMIDGKTGTIKTSPLPRKTECSALFSVSPMLQERVRKPNRSTLKASTQPSSSRLVLKRRWKYVVTNVTKEVNTGIDQPIIENTGKTSIMPGTPLVV